MPPRTTIWELDPHTIGKHLVLKHYLAAWLPIMGQSNRRVLFIDAFAGPGEYSGGEQGSPIIALRSLITHSARQLMTNEFVYEFIEKDPQRSRHLQSVLSNMEHEIPSNCSYRVVNSTFTETLTRELDHLEEQRSNLDPALVMIDPFGVSETPMAMIARIMANPKAEVYISFMYDFINRFLNDHSFENHLDDLFGTASWRQARQIGNADQRKQFLYQLYSDQLKSSGAKQVLYFEMYQGSRLVYAIFFGTKNLEGSDRMKQAIWKVAPSGDYRFVGGFHNQLHLGPEFVGFEQFREDLFNKFNSTEEVDIAEVVEFAKSDGTMFHSGQLKRDTLRPMEREGAIRVRRPEGSRQGYSQEGTKLQFLAVSGHTAPEQPTLI